MFELHVDRDAIGCTEVIKRLRSERDLDPIGQPLNHSVGGWQTRGFRLGAGWLGEAMLRRLERAGVKSSVMGTCWGTVLPPGAEYARHRHGAGSGLVAVWCLTGSGGALHVGLDVVVDAAGQLIVFPQSEWHRVPVVEVERVTIAANL